MSRIGTLWQHGPDGIFIEHRATDLCVRAIEELRGLLADNDAPDTPVVVTAAPASDPYLIAPTLAAVTLTEVGWRAHNLGPDTPLSVLALAARQLDARMMLVSVGVPLSDAQHAELEALIADAAREGRLVALGGRFLDALKLPEQPHLFIGRSFGELAAFGRGFVRKLDQASA
jgi:methanogenic corrinoid protein MtbC1